jgi:hypothetical protein
VAAWWFMSTNSHNLWNKHQLAEYLGLSVFWVDKHVQKDAPDPIPHLKIGKCVRFDPDDDDFNAWLDKHRVLTALAKN